MLYPGSTLDTRLEDLAAGAGCMVMGGGGEGRIRLDLAAGAGGEDPIGSGSKSRCEGGEDPIDQCH